MNSTEKNRYGLKFESIDDMSELRGTKYKNTVDVYNTYYNNYINLLNKNPDNMIWVDYYKILETDGYEYLNQKLSKFKLSLINSYQEILNKSSKEGVDVVRNSEEALQKRNHNYTAMKIRCDQLNLYPDTNIINYFT